MMEFHGFLAVDKPLGWTSHDVVARVRKATGMRRVGHAGTLDPAATGVLVVGVGRATRFLDLAQVSSKGYVAHIALGVSTDSLDVDGRMNTRPSAPQYPSSADMTGALGQFTGRIEQIPPKHSAIKQRGEPLYRRLRRGEEIDVPTRTVQVNSIELVAYSPPDLVLNIECGSGVYIRSLAVDLGQSLDCDAYLHHLVRTRVGAFSLSDCWSLDDLKQVSTERWPLVATSADVTTLDLPAMSLSEIDSEAWYHGRSIMSGISPTDSLLHVRAYTHDGIFGGLGVLDREKAQRGVRPRLVIPVG